MFHSEVTRTLTLNQTNPFLTGIDLLCSPIETRPPHARINTWIAGWCACRVTHYALLRGLEWLRGPLMLKTGSPDNIINPPCLPVSQLETVISENAGLNGKREGLADVFARCACVRVVRVVQMLRGGHGEMPFTDDMLRRAVRRRPSCSLTCS